jgi:uncharacterized protein (TIGR03435 family)
MRLSVCAVVCAANLFSQTLPSPPAFEVASVKPASPVGGRMEINGFYTYPGGRIVCHGCTLEYLLENAFDVQAFQLSGVTGWMTSDRFEIEARPPASSKSVSSNPASPKAAPNAEQRQMLQTLLADRFQLKARHDVKRGPVYLLMKGSKPLRLEDPKVKSDFEWVGSPKGGMITGDGIAGESISMPVLAVRLSRYLGSPVLDKTAIDGQFDFRFDYVSGDDRPDVISAILASVQGIGLKLEASKGPVETIVIDHAEKPSEN